MAKARKMAKKKLKRKKTKTKTASERQRMARVRERNKKEKTINAAIEVMETSKSAKQREEALKQLYFVRGTRLTLKVKNTLLKFVQMANEKEWVIRWRCAHALADFNLGEKSQKILRQAARKDPSKFVQTAALNSLERMKHRKK